MERASFGTVKDFCDCGAILPIPACSDMRKGSINCRVCDKPTKCVEVAMVVMSKWEKRYDADKIRTTATGGDEPSEDAPAVERLCSKCGHNKMHYATRQTRSADEGMTVFFTCVNCGYKDIEYS